MSDFSLLDLEQIIATRAVSKDDQSWTARLVDDGIEKAAKKLGEEAVETVIAAVAGDRKAVIAESADLLYHWLVVLKITGIPLSEVMAELSGRTGRSGLAEKNARR